MNDHEIYYHDDKMLIYRRNTSIYIDLRGSSAYIGEYDRHAGILSVVKDRKRHFMHDFGGFGLNKLIARNLRFSLLRFVVFESKSDSDKTILEISKKDIWSVCNEGKFGDYEEQIFIPENKMRRIENVR